MVQVRAQLHGARLFVVVHVLLVAEVLQDHARLPHLAPAEHHYEADLAARRSAALDQLGQLRGQTRAVDVVFRELVVVGQHHVLGEAGQVGITDVLLAGGHDRGDERDEGNDKTQNGQAKCTAVSHGTSDLQAPEESSPVSAKP